MSCTTLTYDPSHNIAYPALKHKPQQVTTMHVSDNVRADIAPDGMLYGIELLNANTQLAADGGTLAFINEASGARTEFKLAG